MDEETLSDLIESFAGGQRPDQAPPSPEQMSDMLRRMEEVDPELLKKLARAAAKADLPEPPPGAGEQGQPVPPQLRAQAEEALRKLGPELAQELARQRAGEPARSGQPGDAQRPGLAEGRPQPGGDPSAGTQRQAALRARAAALADPALRTAAEEALSSGRALPPEAARALGRADPELARALSRPRAPDAPVGPGGGDGPPGGRGPGGRRIWVPGQEGPGEQLGGEVRGEGALEVAGEDDQARTAGGVLVPFESIPERFAEEAQEALQRQQVPEVYERVVREYFGRLRERTSADAPR